MTSPVTPDEARGGLTLVDIDRLARASDGWRSFAWTLGPIWPVAIGVPNTGGRQSLVMPALIDTGGSHMFAVRSVFDTLGIPPTGQQVTTHSAGLDRGVSAETFHVDLAIPYTTGGAWLCRDVWMTEITMSAPNGQRPYDVVLGTKLLTRFVFTLDGPRSRFRLEPGDPV